MDSRPLLKAVAHVDERLAPVETPESAHQKRKAFTRPLDVPRPCSGIRPDHADEFGENAEAGWEIRALRPRDLDTRLHVVEHLPPLADPGRGGRPRLKASELGPHHRGIPGERSEGSESTLVGDDDRLGALGDVTGRESRRLIKRAFSARRRQKPSIDVDRHSQLLRRRGLARFGLAWSRADTGRRDGTGRSKGRDGNSLVVFEKLEVFLPETRDRLSFGIDDVGIDDHDLRHGRRNGERRSRLLVGSGRGNTEQSDKDREHGLEGPPGVKPA
jgi:hypothetical protein